jgi:DNA-binding PadR family transcriptional regulator
MNKKLTRRQQTFLNQFLDIYQECDQPLHYIVIAKRLGIGNVTAYEMLRLLEEQRLIRSEYQTNTGQHGPGRSAILFYPTQEAKRLMTSLARNSTEIDDWLVVKEQILKQLKEGKVNCYEELLSNLLDRIPERRSPLIIVTELITALILMLISIKDAPEIHELLVHLQQIGLSKKFTLSVMSGIAMILSVMERANRHYSTLLLTQFNRYEEALSQLNDENRQRMGEFTREAVQILCR